MLWIGRIHSTQVFRIYFSCNFSAMQNLISTQSVSAVGCQYSLKLRDNGVVQWYVINARIKWCDLCV